MKAKPTIRELYGPAMEIADQDSADEYFELLVERAMESGLSRTEAEKRERVNLGYLAGYYGVEIQKRVQGLFGAAHPIFGPVGGPDEPKTPHETLMLGIRAAERLRGDCAD